MVSLDPGGVQEGFKEIQDIPAKQAILESKMGREIPPLIGHRDTEAAIHLQIDPPGLCSAHTGEYRFRWVPAGVEDTSQGI